MYRAIKVRRFLLFWFAAYLCILSGVFALALWYVAAQKRSAMDLAEYRMQNASQQFAAYIDSQLRVVDLALLSTIEMGGFKSSLLAEDVATLSRLIRRRAPLFPNTCSMQFFDAQGELLFWRGVKGTLLREMGTTRFFKEQRDSLVSFQTFTYPPGGPLPRLYMSRRVEDANGRFLGVLVVCVSVSNMISQYWEQQTSSSDYVVLYDMDYQLLGSWSSPKSEIPLGDKPFPQEPLFNSAKQGVYLKGGSQLATTDTAVLATTQLNRLPFHVAIAGSTQRLLRAWRASTRLTLFSLLFSAIGVTVVLIYAAKQFARRSNIEIELHLVKLREALYTAMFTKNPAMQLLVEPRSGRIMDANPSACRFYGFDAQQKQHGHLQTIDRSEDALCTRMLSVEAATDHPRYQFRHRVANGDIRDVEAFVGNIVIEDTVYLHAILSDITPRLQAEAALIEAKAKAEEANKAKSAFLASMSHEIRTPLNGVLGMLQLLEDTQLQEDQAEFAQMALQASKRLNRLLSDILDLSRVEAGKLSLQEAAFSMAEVRASVLDIFGSMGIKKKIGVTFTLEERLPEKMVGDDNRLRQILFNLVGNAVKFTSEGYVRVEASLAGESAQNGLLHVAFAVADTGCGIPQEKLNHIFDPFEQVENTYVRKGAGFGLGLAIVNRLVELMGGSIVVSSEEGSGTVFRVVLPFRRSLPEQQEGKYDEQPSPAADALQDFRVLLAEDDPVSRLLIKRFMEKQGYAFCMVEDGGLALQALRERNFDLILMDVQMPVMDGLEATRAIRAGRAGEQHANVPIIALTAYAMANEKEKILESGVDICLVKPVELKALLQAIGQICGGKECRGN